MNTETNISLADAVRHLIVCDSQFTWAGQTTLQLSEMLDLRDRGWVVEGDDNGEFDLTDAGRAVVAQALQLPAPTGLASAAVEKLSAQIGQAILGEPVTDLIELANRCNALRASSDAENKELPPLTVGLDHAAALLWNWYIQLEGHVYDVRDVSRTLTSNGMQDIGVDPKVVIDARHKNEAVLLALREILRALAARQPVCRNCNGVGLIPYTSGQTAESFEQGEYPCPDCAARQPAGNGWSGWATQKPGHMPKLWGTREIADLNHDLTGDARLIFLSEQPAQVDLGQFRELAQGWIDHAARGVPMEAADGDDTALSVYDDCGSELLALIDSQGVGK